MQTTTPIKINVAYFEMYEDDFATLVWNSSKGLTLFQRIIAAGVGKRLDKKHGPVAKNEFYTIEIHMPRTIFGNVRYKMYPEFR